LAVLKSPTAKKDFVDFLQIETTFLKTNYITFSYLQIPIDGQNISEVFGSGREISILLDIYRHWLLKWPVTKWPAQRACQTEQRVLSCRGKFYNV
jgi:hypothetical protein